MVLGGQHQDTKASHLDRWYPVEANLDYRIVHGGTVLEGRGTTLEVSSRGVVFKSERRIPRGLKIEAWVDWPVRLDNVIALKLHIQGTTLRSEGALAVVRILRHEFRISNRHLTSLKCDSLRLLESA